MSNQFDVIIIGAGVIGLTQAVALTQTGFRVAIIDAAPAPSLLKNNTAYDTRVFALNRYSQRILEALGIWEKISPHHIASYQKVKVGFNTSQPQLCFDANDESEADLGNIVEPCILRKAALDVLAESSLCTFFWEHELKSREEFQAPLLIGADGVHSQVRKLCHIETENFPTRQTALVFYIKIEKSHQFEAYQYFCAQGIVAFLPLPDAHHYSIVWSIPEDYAWIKDLNETALASELNNICARRWGKITLTSTCQIFPLIQRQAQYYVLPGVALIGDAAHVIHPLAGQGANLGLADVAALTAQLKIAQQRHRHLGDIAILKPYERARRSAAWQMMMLMSMLKNFTSSSFIFSQTLLQGSRFLQRFSPLKNALSRFALYNFTK